MLHTLRFLSLLPALLFFAQSKPGPDDALKLLDKVNQRYADAETYHIEAVKEEVSSNEYRHEWRKELLIAIVAPEDKYRYEGRSAFGSGALISDGKTRWAYHADEHLYTEKPVTQEKPKGPQVWSEEEAAANNAKDFRFELVHMAERLKEARFLRDQKLSIGGKRTSCYVIHFSEADFKTRDPERARDETIWIDKLTRYIVKRSTRFNSYIITSSGAHLPFFDETTTTYLLTKLDQPEPDSNFHFSPPPDAKLVADFPNPFTLGHYDEDKLAEMLGKLAPNLIMKKEDGQRFDLASLKGKPAFIDFWASWCGPCVASLPDLVKLYAETHLKGMEWLSIDNDQVPSLALTFLKREHAPWPNFHDEDGTLGKAYKRHGIPLGVLIDASGKIVFYKSGYDIGELKTAIRNLGGEYSSLATADSSAPSK